MKGRNESIPMTRRFPELPQKQLIKDSKVAAKMIKAWDIEQNADKVLEIYLKEKDQLSDERYWELMRTVWIICGSNDNAYIFRKLMVANRKCKSWFMTPEESAFLSVLQMPLTIYRAHNGHDKFTGISWTISHQYAQDYRQMFHKTHVTGMSVNRDQIFAYINRNNEHEIIIL